MRKAEDDIEARQTRSITAYLLLTEPPYDMLPGQFDGIHKVVNRTWDSGGTAWQESDQKYSEKWKIWEELGPILV